MEPVLKILLAYLIGSVSGSLVMGRLKNVDIRTMGSGNAGGTNALRTQGFWFALAVVIIDVGKGALAVGWVPGLNLPGLADAPVPERLVLAPSGRPGDGFVVVDVPLPEAAALSEDFVVDFSIVDEPGSIGVSPLAFFCCFPVPSLDSRVSVPSIWNE